MSPQAKQGCWTCKRRKIGCDRTIPSCNNCIRTQRECLGYGLRLAWPDSTDGRRRGSDKAVYAPPADQSKFMHHYGQHFLNVTFEDILLAKTGLGGHGLVFSRPHRTMSFHTPLLGQDGMLLSYYENIISPMVSTTRSRNGFSTEILPQALSDQSPSASALCNAMLAISAFHRFGSEAALRYKSMAVRYLSESLSALDVHGRSKVTETQLAACMMLCMYSVFDEKDGSWHVHLDGAKRMLQRLSSTQTRLSSSFLPNWFLYYEVLGNFTRPTEETLGNREMGSPWLWQMSESNKSLIIGYVGCSVEVFEILHQITRMRTLSAGREGSSPSRESVQQRLELETRLNNLVQVLDPEEEHTTTPIERSRTLAKADLYRLATLLYLQRVCPVDGDDAARNAYLGQAFEALGMLPVVSSPWPLFIVACESQSDEQRITILQVLDKMEEARNIGNIYVARHVMEMFWKQQDLRTERESREQLAYWHLVDGEVRVPWFA